MKTRHEAKEMAEKIQDEADNLPDQNFFGDSNEGAKLEHYAWVRALEAYASKKVLPEGNDLLEVRNWITEDQWSVLEDYE